jgi:phosphate transport system protein
MTDMTDPTPMAGEHAELRHSFGEQLHHIHQGLVEMASLVLENTKRAGEAVLENRLADVDAIRLADEEVNARHADLEYWVFEVLALQQPVAKDLRFLVAATRMLYELERSGDLAVNCAKAMERAGGFTMSPQLQATLGRLVDESTALFGRMIDGLADMDPDSGERVEAEDDVVDDVCSTFYTDLARDSDRLGLAASIELSRIGRFLERIADHGVNIAQDTTFAVKGTFTRPS